MDAGGVCNFSFRKRMQKALISPARMRRLVCAPAVRIHFLASRSIQKDTD